ncbi:hypothetical protein [Streptomyces griseoluteus]|uniref:hypothetical protein n=1 Tax=Streptomyces griseoluteus TaxID=29306 RepID=UPI0036FA6097
MGGGDDLVVGTERPLLRHGRPAPDGEPVQRRRVADPRRVQYPVGKVPQYVSVADEPLPRNAGGTLLRKQLRERVAWGEPLR